MKRLTFNYCKEPPAENLRTFRLPLAKYWYYPASLANQKLRMIYPDQWEGSIPLRIVSALRRAINDIVYSVIPVTFNRPNNRVILILHTITRVKVRQTHCNDQTVRTWRHIYLAYLGYSVFYSHIFWWLFCILHMGICAIVVCVSGLKSENLSIVCKMFSFTERRKGLSKSPTSGNARGSQLLDLSTRVLRRRGRTWNKMSKLSIFNMSTFRAHLCDKQHPPELTKPVTSMNNLWIAAK